MNVFTVILMCLVVMILVRIKLEIVYTETDKYVLISYLFLKKKFDFSERVKSVEFDLEQQVKQIFDSLDKPKPESEKMSVTPELKQEPEAVTKKVKEQSKKITTKVNDDKPKPIDQQDESVEAKKSLSFFEQIKKYLHVFRLGRQVLVRFAKRLCIRQLTLLLDVNQEDPMINAFAYSGLWTTLSTSLSWLNQYVKKIERCQYDVKTQFSGNNFFAHLECIVTIRIVDIILVGILSIKDIYQIVVELK